MPQLEYVPHEFTQEFDSPSDRILSLRSADAKPCHFDLEIVRNNTYRVSFTSPDHPLPPHPSIQRPRRDKFLQVSVSPGAQCQTFEVGDVALKVDWRGPPVLSMGWKGSSTSLHGDLPNRSYAIDGTGIAHYTTHDRKALHVGLGEAAAPFDLTARGFKVDATDCFGYEVYKTNPMYKHMPLLIKATPEGCVAIVSSSYSRASWSVGAEIDGLWGFFKAYRQDYGGLEEYIIVGRTLRDVVRSYADLIGFPLLAPRYAYEYLSGGYKYTMQDDPPAHIAMMEFANKLQEHDIPCSGHQMSSGYSISHTAPKVRHVFTWNEHRFPEPEEWIARYHALGIRLLTNIKPFILASHPQYDQLRRAKGMFTDPNTNDTARVRLWSAGGGESDIGGHLDFTCSATYNWWRENVSKFHRMGIDGMWNDNNEYTLPHDHLQLALDGKTKAARQTGAQVGLWGRAMQTELMGKASYDGLLDAAPGRRPFVLTRSAGIGTLKYCCSSWSGDNMTSWEGMKGANALALTAGVSLMHQYGHDIGGFEGPQPSPELLLRWIQIGIYGPRFAINCFKTSPKDNSVGEVIEPWMYPEITPLVRKAIKRRYEILPYIYSQGLASHLDALPPTRWIGWGYEQDPEVWTTRLKRGEEQFWFGDSLLVGGVYQPGVSEAEIYLPRSADHFDFGYVNLNEPYQHFASGQWVTIRSHWQDHIPVVARVGGAVQVGRDVQTRIPGERDSPCKTMAEDDYRGVEIFPPRSSSHGRVFVNSWYEDDGISLNPNMAQFTLEYSSTAEEVQVKLGARSTNRYLPVWTDLVIILPRGDERCVASMIGNRICRLDDDRLGRRRYQLSFAEREIEPALVNGFH